MLEQKEIDVNQCDTLIANGGKISTSMFQFFADAANKGREFKFIRNRDGNIDVETLDSSRLEQFDDLYDAYHALQAELEALQTQKQKGLSLDSPEDVKKFFAQ